jgi:hypothetical protein
VLVVCCARERRGFRGDKVIKPGEEEEVDVGFSVLMMRTVRMRGSRGDVNGNEPGSKKQK